MTKILICAVLSACLVGCSTGRWIKVTTVTVPKEGFTYQESFYTKYPSEPEGWPK